MPRLTDSPELRDHDRQPADFNVAAFMEPVTIGHPRQYPSRSNDGPLFPGDLPV